MPPVLPIMQSDTQSNVEVSEGSLLRQDMSTEVGAALLGASGAVLLCCLTGILVYAYRLLWGWLRGHGVRAASKYPSVDSVSTGTDPEDVAWNRPHIKAEVDDVAVENGVGYDSDAPFGDAVAANTSFRHTEVTGEGNVHMPYLIPVPRPLAIPPPASFLSSSAAPSSRREPFDRVIQPEVIPHRPPPPLLSMGDDPAAGERSVTFTAEETARVQGTYGKVETRISSRRRWQVAPA